MGLSAGCRSRSPWIEILSSLRRGVRDFTIIQREASTFGDVFDEVGPNPRATDLGSDFRLDHPSTFDGSLDRMSDDEFLEGVRGLYGSPRRTVVARVPRPDGLALPARRAPLDEVVPVVREGHSQRYNSSLEEGPRGIDETVTAGLPRPHRPTGSTELRPRIRSTSFSRSPPRLARPHDVGPAPSITVANSCSRSEATRGAFVEPDRAPAAPRLGRGR